MLRTEQADKHLPAGEESPAGGQRRAVAGSGGHGVAVCAVASRLVCLLWWRVPS